MLIPTTLVQARSASAELAYVEYTSNVTVTGAVTTIVTAPSLTFDGSTKICAEFYCMAAQPPGGGGVGVSLYDGSTQLGSGSFQAVFVQMLIRQYLTPSAGDHVFSWRGISSNGNTTMNATSGGAGNNVPGYIRISVA